MQVSSWSSWFLCLHLHLAPPNSNHSELHTVPLLYACCILSFRFLSIWHSYSFFQVCSQVTISGDFPELGRDKTFLICWDPCWEWSEFQRITPSAEKIKQPGSRGFASILKCGCIQWLPSKGDSMERGRKEWRDMINTTSAGDQAQHQMPCW